MGRLCGRCGCPGTRSIQSPAGTCRYCPSSAPRPRHRLDQRQIGSLLEQLAGPPAPIHHRRERGDEIMEQSQVGPGWRGPGPGGESKAFSSPKPGRRVPPGRERPSGSCLSLGLLAAWGFPVSTFEAAEGWVGGGHTRGPAFPVAPISQRGSPGLPHPPWFPEGLRLELGPTRPPRFWKSLWSQASLNLDQEAKGRRAVSDQRGPEGARRLQSKISAVCRAGWKPQGTEAAAEGACARGPGAGSARCFRQRGAGGR